MVRTCACERSPDGRVNGSRGSKANKSSSRCLGEERGEERGEEGVVQGTWLKQSWTWVSWALDSEAGRMSLISKASKPSKARTGGLGLGFDCVEPPHAGGAGSTALHHTPARMKETECCLGSWSAGGVCGRPAGVSALDAAQLFSSRAGKKKGWTARWLLVEGVWGRASDGSTSERPGPRSSSV